MDARPDDIDPRAWQQALDWIFAIDRDGDDPAIRAALQSWLAADPEHARAYEQARRIWDLAPRLRAPATALRAPPREEAPARQRGLRRRHVVLGGGLAAAVAIFVAAGGWTGIRAHHMTAVGETKVVALEDGTRLNLNTDSAVRVAYDDGHRDVELLRGEVHFAVARDAMRPFTVTAGAARIDVFGTRFNVRMDRAAVTIDVEEGQVAASSAGHGLVGAPPLRRGERLRIDRSSGLVRRGRVAPETIALWQGGRLAVSGATVAQVLAEIGRYHRGYIVLPDPELASRMVSGTYDLTRPIEAARAVMDAMGGRLIEITPFLAVATR